MVKLWSLYIDFKKTSARVVVYEFQIPRAQNIFMGSRVVHEVQIPRAQNIFMGSKVVYEVQIPRAQNIFMGLPPPPPPPHPNLSSIERGEERIGSICGNDNRLCEEEEDVVKSFGKWTQNMTREGVLFKVCIALSKVV
jgi:hypothetical protein